MFLIKVLLDTLQFIYEVRYYLTGNTYLLKYYQNYSKSTKYSTSMVDIFIGLEDQNSMHFKYFL